MQNIILVLSTLIAVAVGYADVCGRDGFYYNNERSFTICSNGNSYVQPCPPGSRNSGRYRHGGYSQYAHSFCNVNLVDDGYAAKHGYHGNRHHGNNYAHRGHHGNSFGSHGNSYGHQDFGYGHHGNNRGHHGNSYGHHGNSYGGHGNGHFGGHGGFGHHGFDGHLGHYY